MTLNSLLVHTCEIQQKTQSRDDTGAVQYTWSAVVGAPTTCRLQPMNSKESLNFRRSGVEVDTKVFFDSDPGMGPNRRIVFESRYYLFQGVYEWDHINRGWTVIAKYLSSHADNV